jgi:predicted PurR-regulated permease PerM
VVRNADYARTLQAIADSGIGVFYGGSLGRRIVERVQALGGFITLDDLRANAPSWVTPMSVPFRGYRVWELPPSNQGIAALEMLRILEPYDLAAMGHNSPAYLHHLIEAKKLAYADLDRFVGDADHLDMPAEQMLTDEFIAARRALLNPSRAMERVDPGPLRTKSETVYLTVADAEGNMVSFINSIYDYFGSGVVVPGTGFRAAQSRRGLHAHPGLPNTVAPGKRPFHTLIPGFVTRTVNGREEAYMSFGLMGGGVQAQGHVQLLLNHFVFGMDLQAAIDAPRFRHYDGYRVALEAPFSDAVRTALQGMGHVLIEQPTDGLRRGAGDHSAATRLERRQRSAQGWHGGGVLTGTSRPECISVRDMLSPFGRLLLLAASAVALLAGMRAATPVIGPVLIALLMSIAWSPGSRWLRQRGWPPTLAALTGILLGVVIIALLGLLLWSSALQLQEKLPEYQDRMSTLRDSVTTLLQRLPFDTSGLLTAEALQPGAIVQRALQILGGITTTAGTFSLLVLIMAFMMIESVRYPQKLFAAIAVQADADGEGTTAGHLDRFVHSMRSYIVLNTVFGLVAGVANTLLLLALGVDFALLWGVLSFLLSFLPNIGFLLALAPPALLALLQYDLPRALMVTVGFTVINFLVDNVMKPRFVGESLDLSPVVVVLSLVFWGWLLGPVGALLAVPLSIAVKFLLESFDEVRWLGYLMSDRDGDTQHERDAKV